MSWIVRIPSRSTPSRSIIYIRVVRARRTDEVDGSGPTLTEAAFDIDVNLGESALILASPSRGAHPTRSRPTGPYLAAVLLLDATIPLETWHWHGEKKPRGRCAAIVPVMKNDESFPRDDESRPIGRLICAKSPAVPRAGGLSIVAAEISNLFGPNSSLIFQRAQTTASQWTFSRGH